MADYKLFFDRSDPPPEDRFEVNHSAYRLMLSACYRKSAGKLVCVSCHDPHSARVREGACLSCHHGSDHYREAADCAACHMPKRKTQDAIHVTMTDHRIVRRPPRYPDPVRENHAPYEGLVVPFYTKSDPLARALANVRTPSLESVRLFEQSLRRHPADPPTLLALGKTLVHLGQPGRAEPRLRRAASLDPANTAVSVALAVSLAQQGKLADALRVLQGAVASNPDDSFAWLNLAFTHRELKQPAEAAVAFREAIRLQPDLSAARVGLASLEVRPERP